MCSFIVWRGDCKGSDMKKEEGMQQTIISGKLVNVCGGDKSVSSLHNVKVRFTDLLFLMLRNSYGPTTPLNMANREFMHDLWLLMRLGSA